MFCRKCGTNFGDRENVVFCPNCGTKVIDGAMPVMEETPKQEQGFSTAAPVVESVAEPKKRKALNKNVVALGLEVSVFFVVLAVILMTASSRAEKLYGSDDKAQYASADQDQHGAQDEKEQMPQLSLDNIKVGDIVQLGSYEQDDNSANGAEPLEWEVVAQENGKYLLLSHYVIDNMPYDNGMADDTVHANESNSDAYCTWATSTIRSWCNGEFYNKSFTEEEKEYICEVTNKTADWVKINDGKLGHQETGYKAGKGGKDTQDKVFLLSMEEVRKYFADDIVYWDAHIYDTYVPRLMASPTPYAVANGCSESTSDDVMPGVILNEEGYDEKYGKGSAWNTYFYGRIHSDYIERDCFASWGLRSPGGFTDCASFLILKGSGNIRSFQASNEQANKNNSKIGIRPAMWIEVK